MKTTSPPLPSPPESGPATLIDTSRMSAGQRAALETTEAARDDAGHAGFAASLFSGRPSWSKIAPFPTQSLEDQDQGDAFLSQLDSVLANVDPDEIDRTGEIPDAVLEALADIGAFGIKIPRPLGGLGLSQTNYSRAAMTLGAVCGNLTALLSAHQSIGVPQPLIMFGTDEQKRRFLPRIAAGEISAFALTEPDVGSDPARMKTTATPTEDGTGYVLNGEKLWCTNGTRAGVLVVMARTPADPARGASGRAPITAFIVEAASPGVEIVRRCHFMGLRALYNGVIRFNDVRVPRENILLGEGKGLRVALSTLNIGRITLPAACTGAARRCLDESLRWSARREQWGARIGDHAAIADKLARMSAWTFGMESLVLYLSSLVDSGADVRLEAALAKLWASERAWQIVDDTMQIRGGRGYETAGSLRARGERPVPVERFFRDCRINTIFEGSSEIMRLFIAREALDPHLKAGAPVLDRRRPLKQRASAALGAGRFYAKFLPNLLIGSGAAPESLAPFQKEAGEIDTLSRRLARALMASLIRFGPKLQDEQLVLARLVDASAELLAAACGLSRAAKLLHEGHLSPAARERTILDVTHLTALARERAATCLTQATRRPTDRSGRRLARMLMRA